ncbi:hypothetical protein V1478_017572 [Vespula squamosa]|uniref:Uncharacterized protein n=1 Tax=Vespula squamosa TaxID=30214 RepID=A0ABD1ZX77_VESSQ
MLHAVYNKYIISNILISNPYSFTSSNIVSSQLSRSVGLVDKVAGCVLNTFVKGICFLLLCKVGDSRDNKKSKFSSVLSLSSLSLCTLAVNVLLSFTAFFKFKFISSIHLIAAENQFFSDLKTSCPSTEVGVFIKVSKSLPLSLVSIGELTKVTESDIKFEIAIMINFQTVFKRLYNKLMKITVFVKRIIKSEITLGRTIVCCCVDVTGVTQSVACHSVGWLVFRFVHSWLKRTAPQRTALERLRLQQ